MTQKGLTLAGLQALAFAGALLLAGCGSSKPANHGPSNAPTTVTPGGPATSTACTIPQNNGGDHDSDNNGGPDDGDGCDV